MRLPPLPSLREIIKLYGITASKQLSQNFLLDLRITDKIVKTCGDLHGAAVVEIGPGPGSLTRPLLSAGAKVIAIEKDERFIPALQILSQAAVDTDEGEGGRLYFKLADALEQDEAVLIKEFLPKHKPSAWDGSECNTHLVGNLPFAISSPLLLKWLRQVEQQRGAFKYGRARMTLMFQKEFATRIIAVPKTKDYGRLSVVVQNWCEASRLFDVKANSFIPPPKVDASVISIVPRIKPLVSDVTVSNVEEVGKKLFGSRRKTLKSCFKGELSDQQFHNMLNASGISGRELNRPEELSVVEVCRLTREYIHVIREQSQVHAPLGFFNRSLAVHSSDLISDIAKRVSSGAQTAEPQQQPSQQQKIDSSSAKAEKPKSTKPTKTLTKTKSTKAKGTVLKKTSLESTKQQLKKKQREQESPKMHEIKSSTVTPAPSKQDPIDALTDIVVAKMASRQVETDEEAIKRQNLEDFKNPEFQRLLQNMIFGSSSELDSALTMAESMEIARKMDPKKVEEIQRTMVEEELGKPLDQFNNTEDVLMEALSKMTSDLVPKRKSKKKTKQSKSADKQTKSDKPL